MKNSSQVILLLLLSIFVMGSIEQVSAESQSDAEALVKKSIEVWNTGDEALAKQIFTIGFTFNMVDHANPGLKGIQGILDYSKFLRTAYPDMKYTPNWMVVDGDMVITQMSFKGTNTGPRGDTPPTGKTVTLSSILVAKIKDGKISEEWVYTNEAAIYRQLGITSLPSTDTK